MSFTRHITRNFDANKTHRIRYDKDDFTCQIYRYDKTQETQYSAFKGNLEHNGKEKNWHGMKVIKSENKDRVSLKFTYTAKETSDNYRLEFLYGNTYLIPTESKKDKNLLSNAEIYVNDVKQETSNGSNWNSTDVNFTRHHQYVHLLKGENTIEYRLTPNSVFIALSIKKFDIYEAKRHNENNDKLTMIKATVEHTKELQINTMTAEFMYHHDFDEKLDPTNAHANRSGLIFDYRDEINLYVKDTEGNLQQVFGGYISTVEVDEDLTKMTMQCADRLIDLDRRYNLTEIQMKEEENNDDTYDYAVDFLKDYTYYSSALKFLLKCTELPIKTNVKSGDPLVARKNWKLATYKKGATEKLDCSNMSATPYKNSMTLRNGDDTLKQQHVTIYNNKSRNVCLNDYPNIFFHYGLGTEKWTEKYEAITVVEKTKAPTNTEKKWIDRANGITKATDVNKIIYDIWHWIPTHTKKSTKSDFYQSAETTWEKKEGNCCCRTELMFKLLEAKGITNLKYCHIKKGLKGHVFGKVNGFYVDPSTSQKSKGWHNHIVYPKGATMRKVTDYPTKPF